MLLEELEAINEIFKGQRVLGCTGSSGVSWSAGESLRLYAAQRISLDFFRVSSILHAAKSAAAATSYFGV